MKICDLHGMKFEEGKEKIISVLNLCIIEKEFQIRIIHGYHGHIFKDYIQGEKFRYEMQEEGFFFSEIDISSNQGFTDLTIESNFYQK